MARLFKHAISGDINARYRGAIYGSSDRFEGFVPLNYSWSMHWHKTEGFKYVWVYRTHDDGTIRPFSWLKVKQIEGKRGPSPSTILKMFDELTQRVLEFESDDEIQVVTLGKGRSKKRKKGR